MTIAVTGGSGYIGSHVVRALLERGDKVLVIDEVMPEVQQAGVEYAELNLSSVDAVKTLEQLFHAHNVTAVIHLAARKQVGESVEKPVWYYRQNLGGQLNLLEAMNATGVNKFVLSSSATVYESVGVAPLHEYGPVTTNNPYGETKLAGEWLLRSQGRATGLRHVSLRYFNVAGAGSDDLCDPHALNLIPIVFNNIDKGATSLVFGDDYETPDGTCIRDYIHVADLAAAHLAALDYLGTETQGEPVFNVGTGLGSSVTEVLAAIRTVVGEEYPVEVVARRAGDPPSLIASVDLIRDTLGWEAKNDLHAIVESAWSAHRALHDK